MMVGDRFDTDVRGGVSVGILTCLVESGCHHYKDQPFYHLLAQNETGSYEAYVSEQNLVPEENPVPVEHPGIMDYFEEALPGQYQLRNFLAH